MGISALFLFCGLFIFTTNLSAEENNQNKIKVKISEQKYNKDNWEAPKLYTESISQMVAYAKFSNTIKNAISVDASNSYILDSSVMAQNNFSETETLLIGKILNNET